MLLPTGRSYTAYKVNYEVLMPDKRKRRKVFHVNMVKKWYPPVASSFWSADMGRVCTKLLPT